MKQYEVRWAELPAPVGRRPVLLLTRDAALSHLSRVLVAEITTTIRSIPQEVRLGRREGLAVDCVANFDNVNAIATRRIGERIGAVARAREPEVKRALGYALGWPELKIIGDRT